MGRIGRTAPVSSFLVDQPTPVYKQLALQLNTPGTFAFTVPAGVNFVDVVLIGGGGGGNGSGVNSQGGGTAGSWAWQTLAVGVTIQTGSVITLTVGSGGPGGNWNAFGANGTASTATASGWAGLTASGGVTNGPTSPNGASPGNLTFDYHTFVGGTAVGTAYPGNAPGGGGGSGYIYYLVSGGSGASGAAWIYTYTNVDVPPQGQNQIPAGVASSVGMARL